MKLSAKVLLFSTIGLLTVSMYSCSESTEEISTEINADNVVTADYNVEGMVCAMGCAKTIQDELSAMNGVASCEVSFENGTAHVEFDKTQLSENDVIAAIEGMADGKYKVNKNEESVESEEDSELEVSEEGEGSVSEVSLPSFEMPNLVELLFNQL
jgi:copper chaperone CopZ